MTTEITLPIVFPVSPPTDSPTLVMARPISLKMPLMMPVTAKKTATVANRSLTILFPSPITSSGSVPSVTPRVIMAICPALYR